VKGRGDKGKEGREERAELFVPVVKID